MAQILDMQRIRYLNLFEKITKVSTKNCFFYNNFVIFAVPSFCMSKAIGNKGENVKKLSSLFEKKVKIVSSPKSIRDAEKFIASIIEPLNFKSFKITSDSIIISANKENKALLIGRNKTRFMELGKIVKDIFNKNLRIV